MRYANPATVYRHMFGVGFDPDDVVNADVVAEVEELEAGVAAIIDQKTNRRFDEPATATKDVSYYKALVEGSYNSDFYQYGYWWFDMIPVGVWGSVYSLSTGVKDVTAVNVDGTWNGTTWDDEELVAVENYKMVYEDADRWFHGILVPHVAYRSIRITGTWEDSGAAEVPPEITSAANFVLVDEWRTREMSPQGEIGPMGLSVIYRNPWQFDMVKTAIEKNTFRQIVV